MRDESNAVQHLAQKDLPRGGLRLTASAIHEARRGGRRQAGRITLSILLGITLPFSAIVSLPMLIVGMTIASFGKRTAGDGMPSRLTPEQLTTLVIIPVVGIVASYGGGLGFYSLSTDNAPEYLRRNGVGIILLTLIVALELLVLSSRSIGRRQTGEEIWPFDPEVEPLAGLAEVARLRSAPPRAFLSERFVVAACWADSQDDLVAAARESRFLLGIAILRRSLRRHGSQLACFAATLLAWLVLGGFAHGWPQRAFAWGMTVLSGALLVALWANTAHQAALLHVRLRARALKLAAEVAPQDDRASGPSTRRRATQAVLNAVRRALGGRAGSGSEGVSARP